MARALPAGWDVDISFAGNGLEGLEVIKSGKSEIMFLDLNMPVMDGYQVLEYIRQHDLPVMVIVVSGDVQPEAYERVIKLGALDFIKKPVNAEQIEDILHKYGIWEKTEKVRPVADKVAAKPVRKNAKPALNDEAEFIDSCQEIVNVAMGRAADLLARLLGAFVLMPIPNVNMLEASELRMALQFIKGRDSQSAVCQGFIGPGIAGEAFLIFNDASFNDIARLMKHEGAINDAAQLELLMDVSSVLIGACLKGMAEQLDIGFSQGHPMVLGRHVKIDEILEQNRSRWNRILAIEIAYNIENTDINCDLMLLFTEDSVKPLKERIACLLDE
ncbi:MAG: response regulator [Gammaproteobacteria bacterium]|nr:MAG: response regulator [Gammaproteobacteria bacterium]